MHRTGTRAQWREERIALLEREKELTRLSDAIARERQALPWVEVAKEYVFDTPDGRKTLAELFDGRFSSSSTTSCSRRGRTRSARAAPRSPTASTGRACTSSTRRDVHRGVARPAGGDRGLPRADGLVVPLGVVPRQRLQLRLRGVVDRGAASAGVQLPPDRGGGALRRRAPRRQRVRARGREGVPHLLGLPARRRRDLGRVPVARPRAEGANEEKLRHRRRYELEAAAA